MSYIDAGYDGFLLRSSLVQGSNMLTSEYLDSLGATLSGGSIQGGVSRSNTGKFIIDYNNGVIDVSDGIRSRVQMGYIVEEDKYGIKILDSSGNIVFTASGQTTDDGISGVSANKITAGEFVVDIDVGNPATGFLRLGGSTGNNFLVNDGTTNRAVFGEV